MARRSAFACRQTCRAAFLVGALGLAAEAGEHTLAAPLVMDPIFGNAGDPTAVFHHDDQALRVFHTQRRAGSPADLPFTWYHGTEIGWASSPDSGQHWFHGSLTLSNCSVFWRCRQW